MPGKLKLVICLVMIAIMLAYVVPVQLGTDDYESQYSANEATIASLTTQIEEYESAESVEEEAEVINTSIYSAATAGATVAALQNKYQTLDATVQDTAIEENAEALSAYFTTDRGQTPWFTASVDGYTAVWEFQTTYSFSDTNVSVIWLCHIEEDGTLVAYASATYDVTTNIFSNLSVRETTYGPAYTGADGDEGDYGIISNLVEDLQEYAEESGVEVEEATDEELETMEDLSTGRSELQAWCEANPDEC